MGVSLREAMKRLISTILCALISAGAAAAAPLVNGTVTARNGTPLADVQVQVEIRTVQTLPPSDSQGHFQFDAAALFPAGELHDAGGRLMLKFSKPGFHPVNKQVRFTEGQSPSPVSIQLDPISGSGSIPATEKEALKQFTAAPGSTPLFLIPYTFTGIQASDPKHVNERLRANLERVIVTHLQAAGVSGSQAVSMKLLPLEQANDIDRLRTYGTYLNALGMISGYGAVETGVGGSRSLGVSSTFLVVPQAEPPVGAPVLYVDDEVPVDSVTSPRLYKYLSKLWGRSTVLALGVNDYRQALSTHDKQAFARIRKYLHAERAGAGPGDEALVSQLNLLIGAVDRELAK